MSRPKGLPKTGGKKKGTPNQRTKMLAEAVRAQGVPMCDIMAGAARAMWDAAIDSRSGKVIDLDMAERAADIAVRAGKFFHPTYSQIELSGDLTLNHEARLAALK